MSASIWNPGVIVTTQASAQGTLSETQTLIEGQTLVTFSAVTYTVGVGALYVYLNGVLQVLAQDYLETSTSSITFTTSVEAGDVVSVLGIVSLVDPTVNSTSQPEVNIAATVTTDVGATASDFIKVTGVGISIQSFGFTYRGPIFLRFEGVNTIVNSAILITPNGTNITTAAGDVCIITPKATSGTSDGWIIASYQYFSPTLTNVSSINGGQLAGLRNRIINGNFGVNQRVYVSGATVGAGLYGHDRWKMAASGDSYTFTTTANVTTVTIPAGKVLQQVIEGLNLETGTYTLSWTGTAQGKIGADSYGASGITGSITGGTNTTIEFGPGTVSKVQFEFGSRVSVFEQRPYGMELALCQRYYLKLSESIGQTMTASVSGGASVRFPVSMRATPTLDAGATFTVSSGTAGTAGIITSTGWAGSTNAVSIYNTANNWTVPAAVFVGGGLSAEL